MLRQNEEGALAGSWCEELPDLLYDQHLERQVQQHPLRGQPAGRTGGVSGGRGYSCGGRLAGGHPPRHGGVCVCAHAYNMLLDRITSSQVTLISIALYAIQIVSKQLHSNKQENYHIAETSLLQNINIIITETLFKIQKFWTEFNFSCKAALKRQ